jgi:hypothetical protein
MMGKLATAAWKEAEEKWDAVSSRINSQTKVLRTDDRGDLEGQEKPEMYIQARRQGWWVGYIRTPHFG